MNKYRRSKRWSRLLPGLVVSLVVGGFAANAPSAIASSHREAPMTASDPEIDATDLYAFRRGDDPESATLVLIANYNPAEIPYGAPEFYKFSDTALYQIKIDNDGDAKPDVIYQWRFRTTRKDSKLQVPPAAPGKSFLYGFAPIDPATYDNLLVQQTYAVARVDKNGRTVIGRDLPVPPANVGKLTTPNYAEIAKRGYVKLENDHGMSFAGPRDDPFFVNLHQTFDFLDYPADGKDDLAGLNVLSIVIEVPMKDVVRSPSEWGKNADANKGALGIWTTASRQKISVRRSNGIKEAGPWVQVSRLGNPLINEVIVPTAFKDAFNASRPHDDAQFLPVVKDPELPYLLQAKGFIPKVPPPPRDDLVTALATPAEALHVDVNIKESDNKGFPNGRRLGDDVVDIALKVVGGLLLGPPYSDAASGLSDGIDHNDVPLSPEFPYEALPHPGNP